MSVNPAQLDEQLDLFLDGQLTGEPLAAFERELAGDASLRERVEDVPVLAYHFLRKAEAKVNKKVARISNDALELLKRYAWPGNLRELENTVERAVVLASGGAVEPAHLPLHIQGAPTLGMTAGEGLVASKDRIVREFERQAVARLLAESRGNVSTAARLARITRRNFHRLLTKHRIDPKRFKNGVDRDPVSGR